MRLEGLKEWGGREQHGIAKTQAPVDSAEVRLMAVIQIVMLVAAALIIFALSGDVFATFADKAKSAAIEIKSFQTETQRGGILNNNRISPESHFRR